MIQPPPVSTRTDTLVPCTTLFRAAGHALVSADDVADGVVAHVAHVQRAGRVRQHRQAVVRRLRGFLPHLERAGVVPEALGGGFDGSGVVGGGVGGHGGGTLGAGRKHTQGPKLPTYPRTIYSVTLGGNPVPPPK